MGVEDGNDKGRVLKCPDYLFSQSRTCVINMTVQSEPRVRQRFNTNSTSGMLNLSLHQGLCGFSRVRLQAFHLKLKVTNLLPGFTQFSA